MAADIEVIQLHKLLHLASRAPAHDRRREHTGDAVHRGTHVRRHECLLRHLHDGRQRAVVIQENDNVAACACSNCWASVAHVTRCRTFHVFDDPWQRRQRVWELGGGHDAPGFRRLSAAPKAAVGNRLAHRGECETQRVEQRRQLLSAAQSVERRTEAEEIPCRHGASRMRRSNEFLPALGYMLGWAAPIGPQMVSQPITSEAGARTYNARFLNRLARAAVLPAWLRGAQGRLRARHVCGRSLQARCRLGRGMAACNAMCAQQRGWVRACSATDGAVPVLAGARRGVCHGCRGRRSICLLGHCRHWACDCSGAEGARVAAQARPASAQRWCGRRGVAQERLGAFFGDLPARELKFLLGDSGEVTVAELKALLLTNDVARFDPVAEAFRVRRLVAWLCRAMGWCAHPMAMLCCAQCHV